MAFLGDLVVKIGANANPFTNAMKKGQATVKAFKDSLADMRTTAAVFSKLAASIKAVNNQMDRLVHVSKGALSATQNLAKAEHTQAMNRLRELKMIQSMQQKQVQPQRTSMLDVAGGIGIAAGVSAGVGFVKDMAFETVKLAANAEVMKGEFKVLLGDVGKGVKLFENLEKFAARTSFDLQWSADAARGLLAAGVGENDILNTMQLLGDIAMGDANKLGFLTKAYTDTFSKGRLQGQEIRQFAENGVGLVGALSAAMKKPAAEILAMSENGQIGFDDMKKALESLTKEGGRFHGAMAERNNTLIGQWDSLVEGIQKTGRAIGDSMLPKIKEVVVQANAMLGKFNEMPDRMAFLGDVIESAFDLAFENIKVNWANMLNDMIDKAVAVTPSLLSLLNPLAGMKVADLKADNQQGGIDAARQRFEGLIGRLNGPDRAAGAGNGGVPGRAGLLNKAKPAVDGAPLKAAVEGLFEKLGPIAEKAQWAAGGMLDRMKMKGNAALGTLQNIFTSDMEKKKAAEPKLAGAMNRDSQEAYSLLANAMIQQKDPSVKATEKQTRQLVKAIKDQKAVKFAYVAAFDGVNVG